MVLRHGRKLNMILEPKLCIYLVDETDYTLYLLGNLLASHVNMRVVLGKATYTHESVQSTRLFVAVNQSKFAQFHRQILI